MADTGKRMVPNGMTGGSSWVGPAEVCSCGTALVRCTRCSEWRCLSCDPLGASGCDLGWSRQITPPHSSPERRRRLDWVASRVGYRKPRRDIGAALKARAYDDHPAASSAAAPAQHETDQ